MRRRNFLSTILVVLLLISFLVGFLIIPLNNQNKASLLNEEVIISAIPDDWLYDVRLNVSRLCSVSGRVDFDGSANYYDERNLHQLKDNADIQFYEGDNDDFWITTIFEADLIWDSLDNFSIFSRGHSSRSDEELEVYIWNYSAGAWKNLNFLICDSTSYANETKFVQGSADYWKELNGITELRFRWLNTENHDGSNWFRVDQFSIYANLTTDDTPPLITDFSITPPNPFYNETIIFNCSAVDNETGVKWVKYTFNGDIGLTKNVTFTIKATKTGDYYVLQDKLIAGNWTVTARAKNYAGITATQKKSFKVRDLPTPPITSPPSIMVLANDTAPQIGEWSQIQIIVRNGTANISRLWYRNPFTGVNITLATNFNGTQQFLLNFTTNSAGIRYFDVWAEGFDGGLAYDYVYVEWYPIIEILWNLTVLTYDLSHHLKNTTLLLYRIDIPKTFVSAGLTVNGEFTFINLSSLRTYQVEVYYWGYLVGLFGEIQSKNPRSIDLNCSIINVTLHLEWENGDPIEDAEVTLFFNQTFYLAGVTDEYGNISFEQIPATNYLIMIRLTQQVIYITRSAGGGVSGIELELTVPEDGEPEPEGVLSVLYLILTFSVVEALVIVYLGVAYRRKQPFPKKIVSKQSKKSPPVESDWLGQPLKNEEGE